MSLSSAVLFLHVLAAVVLFGHSLLTPHVLAAIREAPTTAALRPWLRFARSAERANPLAALVLLASGIQLGGGRWDEGWLRVSVALWVVSSVLAVAVVKRAGERLAAQAAAEGDGAITPALEALRASRRWTLAADVLVANDLAVLYLMCAQPGLPGSLAVVAVAYGAVAMLRALGGRKASRRTSPLPNVA